jgi:Tfp pilus assembly pilus retraction ATPase PilT
VVYNITRKKTKPDRKMNKKMILLFSHTLTDKQKEDAKQKWQVDFVYLPKELQRIWSDISPDYILTRL